MTEPQASYVFKLRNNIDIEGDLELARREIETLFEGRVTEVDDLEAALEDLEILREFEGVTSLESHTRPEGVRAYRGKGPLSVLERLIKSLSFVQQIYCVTAASHHEEGAVAELPSKVGPVTSRKVHDELLAIHAVPHYALFEFADVVGRKSSRPEEVTKNLRLMLSALTSGDEEHPGNKFARQALEAKVTTSHLTHDMHYYKAKFFPRMVRSLLNVTTHLLDVENPKILDPFVGSGTLLLEAAALGFESAGVDIDPLSVMISEAKRASLEVDPNLVASEAERIVYALDKWDSEQRTLFEQDGSGEAENLEFPTWLTKNRKMTEDRARQLRSELSLCLKAMQDCDDRVRSLFNVLMSDAIARRMKFRFLGTGVGRFSLTFTKRTIPEHFSRNLEKFANSAFACQWLKQTLGLEFGESRTYVGDSRDMPFPDDHFDVIITSPPYLPASSGRESYAKARVLSLLALGFKSCEELDELVDESIGSMNGTGEKLDKLTDEERDLVEWLAQDDLRSIKASPTARYFLDMREAFRDCRRVLRPGGTAIFVSGKQSTFYEFSSRTPLYVVEAAKLLADEAQRAGFDVADMHHVQLKKSNKNARPRSLDDYYETLIVLQKPAAKVETSKPATPLEAVQN